MKRRTTRAPQREESDEEFELEKQGYKKKSNVKRPIDQERRGNQQKHRKRQCWIVCFYISILVYTNIQNHSNREEENYINQTTLTPFQYC